MNPAAVGTSILGLIWIGGGSIWLLRNRSYRLDEIPRFFMDLLGFPVEYAQATWGRRDVPYAIALLGAVLMAVFIWCVAVGHRYLSIAI